jgi:3,4-dihydroxy 2-butanone 4-phosphate synthase / GTP cyclohydrolase II
MQNFDRIEKAMRDLREGRMVVMMDDEDRENEGDLVLAAEKATPEAINFMIRFGRGLVCLAMAPAEIDRLGLKLMKSEAENQSPFRTAFTVSIEAAKGVTTGISAFDRCHTIQVAVNPSSGPLDIVVPGHIFPLRAQGNGVFSRQGQTEGSVDLATLSGLRPAAVICEILNDDGSMARRPELMEFCHLHQISFVTVEDILHYRLAKELQPKPFPKETSHASHPC